MEITAKQKALLKKVLYTVTRNMVQTPEGHYQEDSDTYFLALRESEYNELKNIYEELEDFQKTLF